MKVCILLHGSFPDDVRVRKEALALVDAGHSVEVICLRHPDRALPRRDSYCGTRIFRLPLIQRKRGVVRYLLEYGASCLLFLLVVTVRQLFQRYDCIQVNTLPDFLVFAALFARKMGARVILDLHEPTPELWQTRFGSRYSALFRLQIILQQRSIAFCDQAITVTEALRARLIQRGAQAEKIAVVSNTTDLRPPQNWRVSSSRVESQSNGFRLVTHGCIDPRYGQDLVIRAVFDLRDQIPGLHYALLGYGRYQKDLQCLAAELGCTGEITFHGYVPFEELIRTILQADMGVIALRRSPYSELIETNKMYEYMALGIPVLASRLPPVEKRFEENSIRFFEPGNLESLKEEILRLYRDPLMRQRMSANASARMLELGWDVEKRRYLSLYETMGQHNTGPSSGWFSYGITRRF